VSHTAFDGVQLLLSRSEMEFLQGGALVCDQIGALKVATATVRLPYQLAGIGRLPLTSVSIAKSGFHESGGIILQSPYCLASGEILRMYSIGSFHSSSVGQYVGASGRSCGRLFFFTGSLTAVGCPRRSTDVRSSGALVNELSGFGGLVGW